MKNLVSYYLDSRNCASKRQWSNWPFHNFYNYYEKQNGNMTCVERWRSIVNSKMETIFRISDFEDLYSLLKDLSSKVPGIGTLHVYDTATCFLQPKIVHLSCGAREAAEAIPAIKIKNGRAEYADFVAYNKELSRLSPLQLEDFLCINKKVFKGILTPEEQLKAHKAAKQIIPTCVVAPTSKRQRRCTSR